MTNRRLTEIWANGHRWRMITVHLNPRTIQYSWGKFDSSVDHYLKMFNGNLHFTFDSAWGSGSERWYEHLTREQAQERVAKLRKSATQAGFTMLGTI